MRRVEKNREKEGAPKLLRSTNEEGRQVKINPVIWEPRIRETWMKFGL